MKKEEIYIHRAAHNKTEFYTSVTNDTCKSNLSLRAKGLLLDILSQRNDYRFRPTVYYDMYTRRDVDNSLHELIKKGYCTKEVVSVTESIFHFYEVPLMKLESDYPTKVPKLKNKKVVTNVQIEHLDTTVDVQMVQRHLADDVQNDVHRNVRNDAQDDVQNDVHNVQLIKNNNQLIINNNKQSSTINDYTIEQMNDKAKLLVVELNSTMGNEFALAIGKSNWDELPSAFTHNYDNLTDRFLTSYLEYYSSNIMAHPEYSSMDWIMDVDVVEKWKSKIMKHWHSKWETFCNQPASQQNATNSPVNQNYGVKNVAAGDEWISSANVKLLQAKMFSYLGWKPNTNLLEKFIEYVGTDSRRLSHWCNSFISMKGSQKVNEDLNIQERKQDALKMTSKNPYADMRATPEQIKEREELRKKNEEKSKKDEEQRAKDWASRFETNNMK